VYLSTGASGLVNTTTSVDILHLPPTRISTSNSHKMKAPSSHSARAVLSLLLRDTHPAQPGLRVRRSITSPFSTSPALSQPNRIFTPFRTPPQFHDALRLISANNTLLLALFTTSTCAPCHTITPLLNSLVETRPPSSEDKYSGLAFAELELDSPDMSNGKMLDLGVEYGVSSMPTLIGFGGRRAERVTERVVDVRMMGDEAAMGRWIDEEMKRGDPFPVQGGGGSGGSGGRGRILSRIFGS
jgi:thiol-disulfide isomerase/thioredoxin